MFVLYILVNLGCSVPISADKPDTWFCVKVIEETAVLLTFPSPREEAVMAETDVVVASVDNALIKDVPVAPYKKSLLLTVL